MPNYISVNHLVLQTWNLEMLAATLLAFGQQLLDLVTSVTVTVLIAGCSQI